MPRASIPPRDLSNAPDRGVCSGFSQNVVAIENYEIGTEYVYMYKLGVTLSMYG